jgi:uncharacterized protein (DUF608 family)
MDNNCTLTFKGLSKAQALIMSEWFNHSGEKDLYHWFIGDESIEEKAPYPVDTKVDSEGNVEIVCKDYDKV